MSFVKKLDSGGYEGDIKKSFKAHDAKNKALHAKKGTDRATGIHKTKKVNVAGTPNALRKLYDSLSERDKRRE